MTITLTGSLGNIGKPVADIHYGRRTSKTLDNTKLADFANVYNS